MQKTHTWYESPCSRTRGVRSRTPGHAGVRYGRVEALHGLAPQFGLAYKRGVNMRYFARKQIWIVAALVLAMPRCGREVHAATLVGVTLCQISLPNCNCATPKTMLVHCVGPTSVTGTKFQAIGGGCAAHGDCSPVYYQNGDFNYDFTKSYEVPANKKLVVTVKAMAEDCPVEDVCPDGTCHEVYCPYTGVFDTVPLAVDC